MIDPKITKAMLGAYHKSSPLYGDFAVAIKEILAQLALSEGLKILMASGRPKDPIKLKEKIERKSKQGKKYSKLDDIEDLAGARIVFYLESDKEKFINALYEKFKGCIKEFETKYEPSGYRATHFIFKLDRKRSNLPEYTRFKGLKCEIQVTSSLYHAWSEVEHDIIYKPDGDEETLKEIGLDDLESSFEKVMKEHIQAASAQLDYSKKKYDQIIKAGKLFASDFLKDIVKAKTNEEVSEKIAIVKEFFHKKPEEVFSIVQTVLNKKPLKAVVVHEFQDGKLYGKNHEELILECISILRRLRYYKPDEFLNSMAELMTHTNVKIKEEATQALKDFCKYDFDALTKVGYSIQRKVLDFIKKWSPDQKSINFDFIMTAAENLLSSSVEGFKAESPDTMTMQFGAVQPTEFLKTMRYEVINLVTELYAATDNPKQKLRLARILEEGLRTPHNVAYGDDISQMITEGGKHIIMAYDKMVFNSKGKLIAPLGVVIEIEKRLYWAEKNGLLNFPETTALRSKIEANNLFKLTQLLLGNDMMYRDDNAWENIEQKRIELIDAEIDSITNSNIKGWINNLNTIASEKEIIDEWQFVPFRQWFIKKLAATKPKIAEKILEAALKEKTPLMNFADGFLSGFRLGGHLELWDKFTKQIAAMKNPILTISIPFSLISNLGEPRIKLRKSDATLLKDLINQSGKFKFLTTSEYNYQLHYWIIQMLTNIYTINPKVVENLIVEEIKRNPLSTYNYLQSLSFAATGKVIDFSTWNKASLNAVFKLLREIPDLDWHAQDLLTVLSNADTAKIIEIFINRIELDEKRKSKRKVIDHSDRYSPVPHDFNEGLKQLISSDPDIASKLHKHLTRLSKNWSSYNWHLGNFIERAGIPLKPAIQPLLDSGDNDSLHKAMGLLSPFDSKLDLNVTMEIVGKTNDKDILSALQSQLFSTGVVNGEDGISRAHEAKAKEVEKFKNDTNPKIKKFANSAIKNLNAASKSSKQQADDGKLRRRLEFEG